MHVLNTAMVGSHAQRVTRIRREERQAPNTARSFRKAGGDTNVSVRDRSAPRRLEHLLLPSMMMDGRRALSVEWKEMPSSRIALILAHTTVLTVGNNGKEGY